MSPLLLVSLLVLLVQFIVHFWRKGKLTGRERSLYNHTMLVGNFVVMYALVHMFLKTKKVAYLLPVAAYLAVYLIHGHDVPNTGEAWTLSGGIAFGVLSTAVKM